MEAISEHIEEHVGKIDCVYHELISHIVHIDIHRSSPTPDRPYYTLVTSGMSDIPMTAPEGMPDARFAELMLCLPADWKVDQEAFQSETNYWPLRWLKILARLPHEHQTWLWENHTIPNGDPPVPIAVNTKACCMMLATPATVSTEFWTLEVSPGKTIHFFSVIPLLRPEMELKLQSGAAALRRALELAKVSECIDLHRKSVV